MKDKATETKTKKPRTKPTADTLHYKRIMKEAFPEVGKVRAPQIASYLGIGASTWWLYVKEGRVNQPVRYGARLSVWDSEYIRGLAANGIPAKAEKAA